MMNTPTHRIERLLCALFVLTPLAAVAQMAAPAPVAQEAAGTAATPTAARSAVGTGQVLSLPGGGRVWATEDPANLSPQMNVSASGIAGLRDDQVVEGLSFNVSNNYAHFIERMELLVYAGRDTDMVRPLVRLPVPVSGEGVVQWDGRLPAGHRLRPGDTLVYLVRAYGRGGQADETQARTVRLYTEEEWRIAREQLISQSNELADGFTLDQRLAREAQLVNGLVRQNIPVSGSIVRIFGQDIPDQASIKINGKSASIDVNQRFVSEVLLPVGSHALTIEVNGLPGQPVFTRQLDVNISGEYFFMVGMADFYLSKSQVTGNIEPAAAADGFEQELLKEGRLAFYLKGKVKGKYLFTAQADTEDQELNNLFHHFFKATPQDVFRRLDPDQYYAVYGDDSTSYRDADTAGKLYLRLDWDKNQAVWGSFNTGISGGEFNQYNRTLYGGAFRWRSSETTPYDDPRSQVSVFASEAQSAKGYSDLLGTGGSLYYLKHTDLLRGTEQLSIEVRDRVTGQVVQRGRLAYGTDYEIDYIQGRIILSRPLGRSELDSGFGIVRLSADGDYENHLLVDYEYVPQGIENLVAGGRGQVWANDHVAVGGTYVTEERAGDDYQLRGLDLTLRAGRGTYLKAEVAQSESTQASVNYSDNGGLTYTDRTAGVEAGPRSGEALGVEARVNLNELGWTEQNVSAGAWYKDREAGYSTARAETGGLRSRESGVEALTEVGTGLDVGARLSRREVEGQNRIDQAQLVSNWHLDDQQSVGLELRRVRSSEPDDGFADPEAVAGGADAGTATYAGLRYKRRLSGRTEAYGFVQSTLQSDEGLKNDRYGLGATRRFGERSSVTGEVSTGTLGVAGKLEGNHYLTPDYNLYSRYTYAHQPGDLFGSEFLEDGAGRTFSVGQRWNAGGGLSLFQEAQLSRRPDEDGQGQNLGLDYNIARHWQLGFRHALSRIDHAEGGSTTRRSSTVLASYNDHRTSFTPRLELRRDRGAQSRDQTLLSVGLRHKFSEDWRAAARLRTAVTEDRLSSEDEARFTEANLGLSYRPAGHGRWAWLGKYTYLYDLGALTQVSPTSGVASNEVDQRAHILASELLYRINPLWEVGGKYAYRSGELREGRNTGAWYKNTRHFVAAQVRLHMAQDWEALVEHRWLQTVQDKNKQAGWLVGLDKQVTPYFRLGVGYNFTRFSDDLRHADYRFKGWYLNAVGVY
ncbi:hypothetical protein [Hydrogenophaga pseudoflava]|uniref:Uncharacterized protein n=1 Tax=Hydrogenophaga pseudoflava TaxID=47421 RepID=A0A4P6X8I0_HYDPS|nr:hypothetical protein [Hydrogenophaga pseudoflava]QBM30121.1 hypothetical protein HPF_20680 [Hydrogenophaga pseudoflava]